MRFLPHLLIIALGLIFSGCTRTNTPPTIDERPLSREVYTIDTDDGLTLTGEEGAISVTENKGRDESRNISIGFRRFRGADGASGAPVFLLAGGPGGSYNERLDEGGARQAHSVTLINLFRRVGDVVLVDLRGVNLSTPNTLCEGAADKTKSIAALDDFLAIQRSIGERCRAKLAEEGFNIEAYTVVSAADDVVSVAETLGYDKISLYGRSFGSHWALTLAKYHGDRIDRMVLEGIEGLDDTYDDPAAALTAAERIAAEAAPTWNNQHGFDTPLEALRNLSETADKDTAELTPFEVHRAVKFGPGYSLGTRDGMAGWARGVHALLAGEIGPVVAQRQAIAARLGLGWDAAAEGMFDCASGISDARRAKLSSFEGFDISGDIAGYDAYCAGWRIAPLPNEFRADFRSDIPVLMFAGSFDVMTPSTNAERAILQFSNGTLIGIMGGSHDALSEALAVDPSLGDKIINWMGGGAPPASLIMLPPLPFEPVEGAP